MPMLKNISIAPCSHSFYLRISLIFKIFHTLAQILDKSLYFIRPISSLALTKVPMSSLNYFFQSVILFSFLLIYMHFMHRASVEVPSFYKALCNSS